MSAVPTAVIFDIGNVLVRWDPRYLYEKVVADPAVLEDLLAHVVTLDWHSAHDAGLPMAEGVRQRTAAYPHYGALIALFQSRWFETIGPVIDGSVALLKRLHAQGTALYALTNFSAETYPEFARRYPFMALFRDVLVSGEVGMIKPDPRIFALAAARFATRPHETLFIDDRTANVAAATAMGFHAHLFTDPETLEAALATFGLV
ncbi:MAG: HAD family hydrolase [Pseudomonadota bacterium]